MSKRDFLATELWPPEAIDGLLALAARIKRGEITGGLDRKVLAMIFMDPSLRTRASFETAMFLHGGHGFVLEPGRGSWSPAVRGCAGRCGGRHTPGRSRSRCG